MDVTYTPFDQDNTKQSPLRASYNVATAQSM